MDEQMMSLTKRDLLSRIHAGIEDIGSKATGVGELEEINRVVNDLHNSMTYRNNAANMAEARRREKTPGMESFLVPRIPSFADEFGVDGQGESVVDPLAPSMSKPDFGEKSATELRDYIKSTRPLNLRDDDGRLKFPATGNTDTLRSTAESLYDYVRFERDMGRESADPSTSSSFRFEPDFDGMTYSELRDYVKTTRPPNARGLDGRLLFPLGGKLEALRETAKRVWAFESSDMNSEAAYEDSAIKLGLPQHQEDLMKRRQILLRWVRANPFLFAKGVVNSLEDESLAQIEKRVIPLMDTEVLDAYRSNNLIKYI